MKFIDPLKEPNKWLTAVLIDWLDQDTPEARADLEEAIRYVVDLIEPGLIPQLFQPWIDMYQSLLAEQENNPSSEYYLYSPKDRKVQSL